MDLLACESNELFLRYFKENMRDLIQRHPHIFGENKKDGLPDDFWVNHVSATFVETVRWWLDNGMKESPEKLSEYFLAVV